MSSTRRILLAIADAPLRRSVADHLRTAANWAVTEAADLDEAANRARDQDLAVVDESLDGPSLCLRLRQDGIILPMLLLGPTTIPRCCGVEAVVPKPLRLPALMTRIDDILARAAANGAGFHIGRWRFDEGRSILEGDGGALVRLTAKESSILVRLCRAAGQVVPRQTLLDEVWGYGAGIDTHTLETHIYKLRRKLGAGVLAGEGGGYRLESRP
ncbi:response regulator transcription factor [Paramagnetospirillum magneticum]|uniref:Response regulator consisting of a CheY-like receiver domain and a winged-helix DNA-binding domain n=1 Tax=Paramagnetospirillum magneticum (strain ATCC 700264 / AMB-1) TaxID=342108 RepID=Q2WBF2_PARM1|nr:response regulator transcription factor [Paramagnetospirillum magneticum]BAE48823.1 Response regulator consisting of a CheY-like receiver domain and a winged-helix DNA-binding domain [Paramagnetospirillum magneticum AMB-1]